MRRFWPLFLFFVIFAVALIAVKPASKQVGKQSDDNPHRIISLSPNITETLFALGLADRVVAVSDFCDFPPEVLKLPKVGGLFNPNLEAIIAEQPDLVILSATQQRTITQLHQLAIPTLAVKSTSISDIKDTISIIGQHTNHQQQANTLLKSLNDTIRSITQKTQGLDRPSVMVALANSTKNQQINTVYIAGQHDFYNELISIAGGFNVYRDTRLNVPSISAEGIIQLNPDIIIDIFPDADDHHADLQQVRQNWLALKHINAVNKNHVYIIEKSYATIPGPRIILLLKEFARIIHPELHWDSVIP